MVAGRRQRRRRGVGGDVAAPDGVKGGGIGQRRAVRGGRGRRRRVGCAAAVVAEHGGEVLADGAPVARQRRLEAVVLAPGHGRGEQRALRGVVGQRLRLAVVAVLQPVLDVAQEDVGVAQQLDGRHGQQPARGDGGERRQRAARAQRRARARRGRSAAPAR